MLTLPERIFFLLVALLSLYLTALATWRIIRTIGRGQGRPDWKALPGRVVGVVLKTVSFAPTFRTRFVTSLFHAFVGWGFTYYLLVDIGDVLKGYIPGYQLFGAGSLGNLYRLGADVLSGGALLGMAYLIVRRFLVRPEALATRSTTLLHPKARARVRRGPGGGG